MARRVVWLRDRAARDAALCGGKGAGLARLVALGFDVPDAFVLTTRAFREAAGFLPDGQPVPAGLRREIVEAYRRLGGRVAVRSSMVGEDAAGRSFAGQLDTVLGVEGEAALLEALRAVWASAAAPGVLRYAAGGRAAPGEGGAPADVAVVVQRQVEPVAAGVAFSADPVSGQRHVVIEATRGLGDALLRGQAAPDRFVVDGRHALAEETRVSLGPDVFPSPAVLDVAALVRRVALRLGAPQDVEWAWDGRKISLLQARSIASLVGRHVYSRRLLGDMAPGLVKPLLWSTNATGIVRRVFAPMFGELVGATPAECLPTLRRFRSRLYVDVTLVGALLERAGLPANFFEVTARQDRAAARPRPSARLVAVAPRFLRFAWREGRAAPRIEAHLAGADRELASFRVRDWSAVGPRDLLGGFDRILALHAESQWWVLMAAMNLAVRMRLLQRALDRWAAGVASGDLMRGLVGMKTLEPNAALQRLGERAAGLPATTREALLEGDEADARRILQPSAEGRELVREVDAFIARFGFLRPHGVDFSEPGWAEDPGAVWRAVGRLATDGRPAPAAHAPPRGDEAAAAVRRGLTGVRRRLFDKLLASTRRHIALRERLSLLLTEDVHETRRLLLALGEQLAGRGALGSRDDVFFLEYDELRALAQGDGSPEGARQLAEERRAEFERDARVELPETFAGEEPPALPAGGDAPTGEYLSGTPASAGVVRGTARVVLDPGAVRGRLTREDVLVIPFTDTAWTPLFATVGGVVAETGGQLSHTAIVAREYSLPTVVGVKAATRLVRDGQAVTVDGGTGRVWLRHLEPGEEAR
jgi:pyruvate,water dikinase